MNRSRNCNPHNKCKWHRRIVYLLTRLILDSSRRRKAKLRLQLIHSARSQLWCSNFSPKSQTTSASRLSTICLRRTCWTNSVQMQGLFLPHQAWWPILANKTRMVKARLLSAQSQLLTKAIQLPMSAARFSRIRAFQVLNPRSARSWPDICRQRA